jgi:hypothetical protein
MTPLERMLLIQVAGGILEHEARYAASQGDSYKEPVWFQKLVETMGGVITAIPADAFESMNASADALRR